MQPGSKAHKLNHHDESSIVLGSRYPETSVRMSKGSPCNHHHREEILEEKGRGGPELGQQGATELLRELKSASLSLCRELEI